jgi:hypothetical protein
MSFWPPHYSRSDTIDSSFQPPPGDSPLARLGVPRSVAADEQRGLVAIGSADDRPAQRPAELGRFRDRQCIRVCDRATMRCILLRESTFPVNSLAFHPTQPLLAVGTGNYDGGMFFYGELLLIHLETGAVVSALSSAREVRTVVWRSWRHGRVLDLALAETADEELGREAQTVGTDAVVERADWLAVEPGGIKESELYGPLRENARTETVEAATKTVQRWCADAGVVWERPRQDA